VNDFSQFGLTAAILRSLEDLGFEEPTPVQARALPILLAGRDMVAQALTGTGKTAAFGIPLIERIDLDKDNIQAVVLTPTGGCCPSTAASRLAASCARWTAESTSSWLRRVA
jgi:ATP-dependent RNA helicase DeaD